MQISKIKASRISNRINLIFSNNSYLPLFIDDFAKLSLTKGQQLDKETLDIIFQKSSTYLGREYALRQLTSSPKSEKLLSQKLNQFFFRSSKKFPFPDSFDFASINQNIIKELKSKNFLNQDDFISYFVNKNRHKSSRQILNLLFQQGIKIDPDFLNKNLPANDLQLIKKYLDKKKIDSKDLSDFKYKQKVIASLYRRGFNLNDISSAIDDHSNLK
jgi:SOS response regulatory protein OraA/RecX